jgi:hypothetical protein
MEELSKISNLWKTFLKFKILILVVSLIGLFVTNLATLLNASTHDFLYTGLRKVLLIAGSSIADVALIKSPTIQASRKVEEATKILRTENISLKTINQKLNSDLDDLHIRHVKAITVLDKTTKSAKDVAATIQKRLTKGLVRNTAAIPAEALPLIGAGITTVAISFDIYDACMTMKDINSLLTLLGQGEESPDFCGKKLPSKGEVLYSIKKE